LEKQMTRTNLIDAAHASGEAKPVLEQIQQKFGGVPAMFQAAANSAVALKSLWGGFVATAGGTLPATLKEQLAVAIADCNDCEYCLAAHTALGRKAGVSAHEMADAQAGRSDDPATAAALGFALKVVQHRAQLSDEDFAALRRAGFDDEAIVEILAHVALNVFTNYLNVALRVPVDFPAVKLRKSA
jgi:uncharacterized peroxidase-related enzyme